jgi:hypothetical protein
MFTVLAEPVMADFVSVLKNAAGPARHRDGWLVPQCGLTAAGRRRCAGTHRYGEATAKSRHSPGTPLSS